MIDLTLGESNFQVIKFNQYDKNYTFQIKLTNYKPVQGDIVKIEWEINNKVAVIQNTDITVNNNVLTVKLLREVTLNSGKGNFNVVVDNTKTGSRKATFKCPVEIVGNSIDEDTVSSVLVEKVLEKLQNEELNANTILTKLLKAISDGNLSNYLLKSGGNVTGNIIFENAKGIRGTNTDGTLSTLVYVSSSDKNTFGNTTNNTVIASKESPQTYINGKTYDLIHKGNILDLIYPIGSIKFTENNVNPSTTLGGTWELVGQGKVIVGVGTGTDKNGVSKTFVAGANEGEYSHTQTIEEMPIHNHPQSITVSNGSSPIARTDYSADSTIGAIYPQGANTYNTGGGQAFNIMNPSYGLYIWKRTA